MPRDAPDFFTCALLDSFLGMVLTEVAALHCARRWLLDSRFPPWMKFVRASTWLASLQAFCLGGFLAVMVLGLVLCVAAFAFGFAFPEVSCEADFYFQQEQQRRPLTWWLW